MKKNNDQVPHGRDEVDYATAAIEQMELYCVAHPGTPSAMRRPRLFVRGELWIALLGPSVEEGIVGIGPTVAAALRAFDAQYLVGPRPSIDSFGNIALLRRPQPSARYQQGIKANSKSSAEGADFAWPS